MEYRIIPVTPFEQNCSMIWCPDTMKGAFVDAGGDIDHLLAAAQQAGITIEKLLLTHGHIDHAGGTGEMAERLDVPIEGPQEEERFWLDQLPTQSRMFGFPVARDVKPDRWLHDGDTVTVGKQILQVLHTPGHTPGGISVKLDGVVFTGDTLFAGSVGRTDLPDGDEKALLGSIRKKLFILSSKNF